MKHTNWFFSDGPMSDQHFEMLSANVRLIQGAIAQRAALVGGPEKIGVLVADATSKLGMHLLGESMLAGNTDGTDVRNTDVFELLVVKAFPLAGFRILARCLGGPRALDAVDRINRNAIPVVVAAKHTIAFHGFLRDRERPPVKTDLPRLGPKREPSDALASMAIKMEYEDLRTTEDLTAEEEDEAVEALQRYARDEDIPLDAAFEEDVPALFSLAIIKGYLEGKLGLLTKVEEMQKRLAQREKRAAQRKQRAAAQQQERAAKPKKSRRAKRP